MLKIWRPIVKSDGLIGSLQVTTKSLETFRMKLIWWLQAEGRLAYLTAGFGCYSRELGRAAKEEA